MPELMSLRPSIAGLGGGTGGAKTDVAAQANFHRVANRQAASDETLSAMRPSAQTDSDADADDTVENWTLYLRGAKKMQGAGACLLDQSLCEDRCRNTVPRLISRHGAIILRSRHVASSRPINECSLSRDITQISR